MTPLENISVHDSPAHLSAKRPAGRGVRVFRLQAKSPSLRT